jgi:predicted PurR-regulated permease PerM
VPYGVDLAAAWAWRFVIIAVALLMILLALRHFEFVVFPVLIALFLTALGNPLVGWLQRRGVRRKLGALIVVVLGIAFIALLLTFVGAQVSSGIDNLSGQVVDGLEEIRTWLQTGPLHATDSQINSMISEAQTFVTNQGKDLAGRVTSIGSALGEIVAGFFLVLFSTYFFLADGALIWAWLVRLFPRTARLRADSSGRVAFTSLTQFVRATVIVAATDAIGVMIWAAVLGLPFVSAIGVLVFLGAFVPMVGATISGVVAILVALVASGPVTALLMLAGVIVVQQIEAHVLQPFLMGRWVSVHPLGVIIAIAMGIVLAGIPGALIAVPLASSLNAIVKHLSDYEEPAPEAEDPPAEAPEQEAAEADGEAGDAERSTD